MCPFFRSINRSNNLSTRVPDLALCDKHPKRNFIRRALELEIRLSYSDLIVKSIPQEMHPPEARCLPAQAPGPNFEYDDPCKYHRYVHRP